MPKLIAEPTDEEEGTAKAVKEAIKGKQKLIAQGIEETLVAEGYGGMDPEKLCGFRLSLARGKCSTISRKTIAKT